MRIHKKIIYNKRENRNFFIIIQTLQQFFFGQFWYWSVESVCGGSVFVYFKREKNNKKNFEIDENQDKKKKRKKNILFQNWETEHVCFNHVFKVWSWCLYYSIVVDIELLYGAGRFIHDHEIHWIIIRLFSCFVLFWVFSVVIYWPTKSKLVISSFAFWP